MLNLLEEAIRNKKVISFEYQKSKGISGVRYGHPYAIYLFTSIKGVTSTKIHIVQVDGFSTSLLKNPFPSFRTHNIEDISDVIILEESFDAPFHPDYNPEWESYNAVIIKV